MKEFVKNSCNQTATVDEIKQVDDLHYDNVRVGQKLFMG